MLMPPPIPPSSAPGTPLRPPQACHQRLGRWSQLGWVTGLVLVSTVSSCGSPELAHQSSNSLSPEPPPGASLPSPQPESSVPVPVPAELNFPRLNRDERGQALRGHDAVAYFTENTARLGSTTFNLNLGGTIWLFSSADNRDRFAQSPERYAPAYGGYCSFGILLGQKFDGNPEVWSIEGDRLYLFLNRDVQARFYQDKPENLAKATQNWLTIRDFSPQALE